MPWAKPRPGDTLNTTEERVLTVLAQGKTNQEIADVTGYSLNTVKEVNKRLFVKLGAHNRIHAVLRARELKFLKR